MTREPGDPLLNVLMNIPSQRIHTLISQSNDFTVAPHEENLQIMDKQYYLLGHLAHQRDFLVGNRLMWSTYKSLSVLISLFYRAAGGASRSETELGSWFGTQSSSWGFFFSHQMWCMSSSITQAQLPFSDSKCTQCTQNTPIPPCLLLLWQKKSVSRSDLPACPPLCTLTKICVTLLNTTCFILHKK